MKKQTNKLYLVLVGTAILVLIGGATYLLISRVSVKDNKSNSSELDPNKPSGNDTLNEALRTSKEAEKLASKGDKKDAINKFRESLELYEKAGDKASASMIELTIKSLETPKNLDYVKSDY